MLKNKFGITLIALVITIIVLLVLAGVIVNLSMGENGLMTKAQTAVDKYKNSIEEEKYDLELAQQIVNNRGMVMVDKDEYEQLKKDAMTLIVNGTTKDSENWEKVADYPNGYGKNDVYIKSFLLTIDESLDISYNDCALQLRSDGIYFWTASAGRKLIPIKILLGVK